MESENRSVSNYSEQVAKEHENTKEELNKKYDCITEGLMLRTKAS